MKLAAITCVGVMLIATAVASEFVGAEQQPCTKDFVQDRTDARPHTAEDVPPSQGVYYMKEVVQYNFHGEWIQGTKQGLIHWQPAGQGANTLELVYEDKTVSLPVTLSGEILQHSGAFFVDFMASGRFTFEDIDLPQNPASALALPCDGSYSAVRSVAINGDCWDAGTIDPATGCTRWKCNKNNNTTCEATISFTDGSPDKEIEWTCSAMQDRKITSCPGGGGGTASVQNATSGC